MSDPRHRRRHHRPASGGRRRRRSPSGHGVPARCPPTRRRPAWSSSTPPSMAAAAARRGPHARWPSARTGRGGRHHQPAGVARIVWDRATGEPVGPRARLAGPAHRRRLHHGQGRARLAARARTSRPPRPAGSSTSTTPTASRDLCVGTVDTWIAWTLTEGALHVTDQTNAGASPGCCVVDGATWDARPCCAAFGIPESTLPTVVDSVGVIGHGHRARRRPADRGDASATSRRR